MSRATNINPKLINPFSNHFNKVEELVYPSDKAVNTIRYLESLANLFDNQPLDKPNNETDEQPLNETDEQPLNEADEEQEPNESNEQLNEFDKSHQQAEQSSELALAHQAENEKDEQPSNEQEQNQSLITDDHVVPVITKLVESWFTKDKKMADVLADTKKTLQLLTPEQYNKIEDTLVNQLVLAVDDSGNKLFDNVDDVKKFMRSILTKQK